MSKKLIMNTIQNQNYILHSSLNNDLSTNLNGRLNNNSKSLQIKPNWDRFSKFEDNYEHKHKPFIKEETNGIKEPFEEDKINIAIKKEISEKKEIVAEFNHQEIIKTKNDSDDNPSFSSIDLCEEGIFQKRVEVSQEVIQEIERRLILLGLNYAIKNETYNPNITL